MKSRGRRIRKRQRLGIAINMDYIYLAHPRRLLLSMAPTQAPQSEEGNDSGLEDTDMQPDEALRTHCEFCFRCGQKIRWQKLSSMLGMRSQLRRRNRELL